MKFFSDVRLLLLGIWLGAAVFFIGVAQSAFAVIPEREVAGALVSRTLSIVNFAGLAIALILIATAFVRSANFKRVPLWIERFLLLVIAVACAAGQFVIGLWLSLLLGQMGRPLDEVPSDDPLRIRFDELHGWSEWVLISAMAAALIVFFLIANRRAAAPAKTNDPYDFSKEFKI
jgi:hypothetical protein